MDEVQDLERRLEADPEDRKAAMRLVALYERQGLSDEHIGAFILKARLCPSEQRFRNLLRSKDVDVGVMTRRNPETGQLERAPRYLGRYRNGRMGAISAARAVKRSGIPVKLLNFYAQVKDGEAQWPPPPTEALAFFKLHHAMRVKNRAAFKRA